MSEPVDIVAAGREAVERVVCYDALSMQWNGRRDSDIVSDLCDEVERLQAELEKERRLHGMARSTISSRTAEVERLQARVAELEGLMISHGHDPEGDKP